MARLEAPAALGRNPRRRAQTCAVLALSALIAGASPAHADGIELSSSDRLAMLYTPQLQFSVDGDPLIKIGIIEGQTSVTFTPSEPIRVLPLGEGGPSTVLPGDVRYTVHLDGGAPGAYRYWPIVGRFLPSERAQVNEAVAAWEARGFETERFSLGSFFAVRGNTFDNRVVLVGVSGSASRNEATTLAQRLEEEFGVPNELHVELVDFPTGLITLTSDELPIQVQHRDLLWISMDEAGSTFDVDGASFATNPEPGDGSNRQYVGSLIFTAGRDGALTMVNELPAERLLEGILPAEIYASAPMAALEAQAVAARGELLADLGVRYLADPYMTCADQRCQVYHGVGNEHRRPSEAIANTRGVVMLDGDHIARAVYSASCGGSLGDYRATWGGEPIAYLRPHIDAYHIDGPYEDGLSEDNIEAFLAERPATFDNIEGFGAQRLFRWEVTRTAEELTESLNERYAIGTVRDLEVLARDESGRVTRLRVVGEAGETIVERELPIRRALGGLRSALFVLDVERGSGGALRSVQFRGGGFGHGVGLCQIGAIGAAERGLDYTDILSHYYPGVSVRQLWD